MTQLPLPLSWPADPADDAFLVTPSNAGAADMIARWPDWPVATAILAGPRKSGRSLLARLFVLRSGGAVIDDAQRRGEADIFHAWNRAQETRRPLLLIADEPPPRWAPALPDLRSRLAASPLAVIEPPDEALMRALFEREFLRRGLDARGDLIDWLALRVERSHVAVMRVIDTLDQHGLAQRRRLSIPLARTVLADAALIPHSGPEDP